MKVTAQILSATLLAGFAAARVAPASQTVQPQQTAQKVQSGTTNTKKASTSPFVPKTSVKPAPVQAKTNVKPAPSSAQAKTSAKPTPSAAELKTATAAKAQPTKPTAQQKTQAKATAKAVSPKAKTSSLAQKATVALKNAPTVTTPAAAKPEETQAAAQNTPAKLPNPGKRDPFLSPIALAASRAPAVACSAGKHCLVVGQIALKGIIQTKEGNIAMVENGARRSYYLHENDALFDGSVVKISGDSVTFRQESSDYLGKPVSKEVIKKVSAPAV